MLAGASVDVVCQRQHLASPESHTSEVVAAGTGLHRVIPIRGHLQEIGVVQEVPTPYYIDSASTIFVAKDAGAVKKSVWLIRRAVVLREGVVMGDIDPIKIGEADNFADIFTKWLPPDVWRRHVAYTQNEPGYAQIMRAYQRKMGYSSAQ
jgi:hypothetical protein